MSKAANVLSLTMKELTSLRYDLVLLLFLTYAFSIAIYMPAAGSVMGVHNASVAVVDEDRSHLSRLIIEALLPPEFQTAVLLPYDQLDRSMDSGRFTFIIDIPANFQRDLNAGRSPAIQVNVDATAMSQAFMGAGYLSRILQTVLQDYRSQGKSASPPPIQLTTRVLFNPNLEGAWFLAVIQIVNNITLLAIILSGTAVLREREHGTLDHLLVLPLSPREVMLSKISANAIVVVACSWASLEGVVRLALDVPLTGSKTLFLVLTAMYLFATNSLGIFLATLARSTPQFGLLAIPVIIPMLLLSGGSTPLESMPLWLQWMMQLSPSTHFVSLSTAILFRNAGLILIWPQVLALAVLGLMFFYLTLRRFRSSLTS
ncbi:MULTISPECIES: ABC transporter permease [unclassified Pseudomonas]|uniref:ABC transporter permease n=1 Tax=unclassified Pseudomonas TaxID=196821 RepID=UPI000D38D7D2|nr:MULTISPECIES: ABC transporter permease [unclassified Pseudomonas]RAU42267.1 ABC transporter permease [Pseudomonas sp. RIT 409]RAU55084.1 ABC transporter permease [Pseudomonas sp. RIT 412]